MTFQQSVMIKTTLLSILITALSISALPAQSFISEKHQQPAVVESPVDETVKDSQQQQTNKEQTVAREEDAATEANASVELTSPKEPATSVEITSPPEKKEEQEPTEKKEKEEEESSFFSIFSSDDDEKEAQEQSPETNATTATITTTVDSIPAAESLPAEETTAAPQPQEAIVIEPGLNSDTLDNIQTLLSEEEYNHALNDLKRLLQKKQEATEDVSFETLERLHFLLIKTHYLLRHYENVQTLAETYFRDYTNGDNFHYALYYYNSALAHLNQPLAYTQLITEDFFEQLSPRETARLRNILVENALKQKKYLTAFFYLEEDEGDLIPQYTKWYRKIISHLEDIDDLNDLLERFSQSDVQSQLYLRKVQLLTLKDEYEEARDTLNILLQKDDLESDIFEEIQSLRKYIDLSLNTAPQKIGVILPLTHRKLKFLSRQVIDGLEMALRQYKISGRPIELVFKDSTIPYKKGDTTRSILNRTDRHIKEAIRELVEEENVIAILGPLARHTTTAAKTYSEQFNVPIISFSLTENIGENAPFLFRFNRKRTQEAKEIAHYAMDYLGAERFVLFYPSNPKGFQLVESFAKVVRKNGGKIVGFSPITAKQVDFQKSFLSFTDGYRQISEEEKEELKKNRERVKPVVDFDAIFAPSTPHTLEILKSFQSLFEADKTWLLALSEINVPENQLLSNTGRLRFIDTYANSDTKTYLQPFFESHWRMFNYRKNYTSPTDYTVYSYEVLEVLSHLLNDPHNHKRESLRKALAQLQQFPVLTGHVSTDDKGEMVKALKILKLKNKTTVEVF